MATVPKGNDVCLVCQRRKGVCTKCSYGHCQSTFHPSCARSAGFFLIMRTNGGKLQHKAYCDKHSLEQRLKSETQRHGVEELKSLKQVRVSDDICLIIYHLSSCISCLAVPFIFLWFFPMFLIFCHFSIFISMAIISAKH